MYAASKAKDRTTGVSNPIRAPSFRLSVSVSTQQSAFAVGLLFDLYAFHRSTGNSLPLPYSSLVVSTTCPGLSPGIGFDGGLKKPPTDALRPIIPDNACILCLTAAAGTELADAYSPRHSFFSGKRSSRPESGPCLSPSVADHPLGPATDHRLGKLLPHQLANQTQAPPRADSSFCSSAYGVLAAVSSCCSPPKGRFLRVTHPSPLETPLPVRLACVKHAASVHPEPGSNSPCASYSPGVRSQKYSHPCPLTSIPRASYPFSLNHGGEQIKIEKLTLGLGIIRLELMTSTTSR
ncbi:hypothetical protein Sango_2927200 [Sesamum angolense]|uniref:Uncharacterized protein n=1 Tax=Sesamum angolense TaxID=2727404 RepID=A0AAE1T5B4_9LAMI|nr:hypothetical protein Sango_2927200 [Sesamum angolense]